MGELSKERTIFRNWRSSGDDSGRCTSHSSAVSSRFLSCLSALRGSSNHDDLAHPGGDETVAVQPYMWRVSLPYTVRPAFDPLRLEPEEGGGSGGWTLNTMIGLLP